jgi:hypothetical protein
MISILKINYKTFLQVCRRISHDYTKGMAIGMSLQKSLYLGMLLLLALFIPVGTEAQSTQTISISPTLFNVSANPGQHWSSGVKIINSNPYDMTIYVEAVDFVSQGESGQGIFVPIGESDTARQTMASWIELQAVEYTVRAEQTITIPFTVIVPENAPPGGHYSALMIGTRPPLSSDKSTVVTTSQVVTSLLFLRVSGDIVEQGRIRSFSTRSRLMERPEAMFDLRFENDGNVHVQPQGEIKIFNMWGQERGVIPINRDHLYGNVLANSVRNYSYEWRGEWSLSDIGRYRALATVAYGQDQRQFDSAELTFYVVPWKPVLLILLLLIGFIALIVWSIKAYVRRVLELAGVVQDSKLNVKTSVKHKIPKGKIHITLPIEEGILDLRAQMAEATSAKNKVWSTWLFINQHRLFFIFVLSVGLFIFVSLWYVSSARVDKRYYEITMSGQEGSVKVSSEQIEYEKLITEESLLTDVPRRENFPSIWITNQSGLSGVGAKLRVQLENQGYVVDGLSVETGVESKNTVIVYSPDFAEQALELSRYIPGALLSAYEENNSDKQSINIYVGREI